MFCFFFWINYWIILPLWTSIKLFKLNHLRSIQGKCLFGEQFMDNLNLTRNLPSRNSLFGKRAKQVFSLTILFFYKHIYVKSESTGLY